MECMQAEIIVEILKGEQDRSAPVAAMAHSALHSFLHATALPGELVRVPSPQQNTPGGGYEAIREDILHEIPGHPCVKNCGAKCRRAH